MEYVLKQIESGNPNPVSISLYKDEMIIGRSTNPYLINYSKVSREHALFKKVNEAWFVRDMNSLNKLYINYMKIGSDFHRLNIGDVISFGVSSLTEEGGFTCVLLVKTRMKEEPGLENEYPTIIDLDYPISNNAMTENNLLNMTSNDAVGESSIRVKEEPDIIEIENDSSNIASHTEIFKKHRKPDLQVTSSRISAVHTVNKTKLVLDTNTAPVVVAPLKTDTIRIDEETDDIVWIPNDKDVKTVSNNSSLEKYSSVEGCQKPVDSTDVSKEPTISESTILSEAVLKLLGSLCKNPMTSTKETSEMEWISNIKAILSNFPSEKLNSQVPSNATVGPEIPQAHECNGYSISASNIEDPRSTIDPTITIKTEMPDIVWIPNSENAEVSSNELSINQLPSFISSPETLGCPSKTTLLEDTLAISEPTKITFSKEISTTSSKPKIPPPPPLKFLDIRETMVGNSAHQSSDEVKTPQNSSVIVASTPDMLAIVKTEDGSTSPTVSSIFLPADKTGNCNYKSNQQSAESSDGNVTSKESNRQLTVNIDSSSSTDRTAVTASTNELGSVPGSSYQNLKLGDEDVMQFRKILNFVKKEFVDDVPNEENKEVTLPSNSKHNCSADRQESSAFTNENLISNDHRRQTTDPTVKTILPSQDGLRIKKETIDSSHKNDAESHNSDYTTKCDTSKIVKEHDSETVKRCTNYSAGRKKTWKKTRNFSIGLISCDSSLFEWPDGVKPFDVSKALRTNKQFQCNFENNNKENTETCDQFCSKEESSVKIEENDNSKQSNELKSCELPTLRIQEKLRHDNGQKSSSDTEELLSAENLPNTKCEKYQKHHKTFDNLNNSLERKREPSESHSDCLSESSDETPKFKKRKKCIISDASDSGSSVSLHSYEVYPSKYLPSSSPSNPLAPRDDKQSQQNSKTIDAPSKVQSVQDTKRKVLNFKKFQQEIKSNEENEVSSATIERTSSKRSISDKKTLFTDAKPLEERSRRKRRGIYRTSIVCGIRKVEVPYKAATDSSITTSLESKVNKNTKPELRQFISGNSQENAKSHSDLKKKNNKEIPRLNKRNLTNLDQAQVVKNVLPSNELPRRQKSSFLQSNASKRSHPAVSKRPNNYGSRLKFLIDILQQSDKKRVRKCVEKEPLLTENVVDVNYSKMSLKNDLNEEICGNAGTKNFSASRTTTKNTETLAKKVGFVSPKNNSSEKEPLPKRYKQVLDSYSLIETIVNWYPQWLDEQRKNKNPPPSIVKGVDILPLNYPTFEEYNKAFYRMLVLESWDSLFKKFKKVFDSKGQWNNFLFTVNSFKNMGEMVDLQCQAVVQNENVSYHPKEGDVVLLYRKSNSQRLENSLFGYIYSSKVEELRYGTWKSSVWKNMPSKGLNNNKLWTFNAYVRRTRKPLDLKEINIAYGLGDVKIPLKLADSFSLLSSSPLKNNILQPNKECFTYCDPSSPSLNVSLTDLVKSVSETISNTATECQTLVLHGPAGCGKTTMIASLVKKLLSEKQRIKVLICTNSKSKLDDIGGLLVDLNERCTQGDMISFVRMGETANMCAKLQNYSMDGNIDKKFKAYVSKEQADVACEIQNLENRINKVLFKEREKAQNKYRKINNYNCPLLQKLIDDLSNLKKKNMNKSLDATTRKSFQSIVLKETRVILATLDEVSQSVLNTFLSSDCPNCCIVDDASQCTELELLQCLNPQLNRLVLIGDAQQLPPKVGSVFARACGFNRSLLERFCLFFKKEFNVIPAYSLKLQYRMHSRICYFPCNYFYSRELRPSPDLDERNNFFPLQPYMVYDVLENYLSNYTEGGEEFVLVNLCIQLVQRSPNSTIGILVTLKEKVTRFKEVLSSIPSPFVQSIEVNTVDSYQNLEKDIIILSCIRQPKYPEDIDFFSCPKKMNVSITRARQSLIICGHLSSLHNYEHWRALLEDAKQRSACVCVATLNHIPIIFLKTMYKIIAV